MGPDVRSSYNSMHDCDKVGFLLNGLDLGYSEGLKYVFIAIANFIYDMYKKRYEIYDERRKGVT